MDQLPREGETATVLTQYASTWGTVAKVRRVYTETEPSREYLTGERTGDKGTFFRSRLSRAITTPCNLKSSGGVSQEHGKR